MFGWLTKIITSFTSFLQQVPTVSVLKERNSILETEKKELQAKIREHEQQITAKTTELGNLQTELQIAREENQALLASGLSPLLWIHDQTALIKPRLTLAAGSVNIPVCLGQVRAVRSTIQGQVGIRSLKTR